MLAESPALRELHAALLHSDVGLNARMKLLAAPTAPNAGLERCPYCYGCTSDMNTGYVAPPVRGLKYLLV